MENFKFFAVTVALLSNVLSAVCIRNPQLIANIQPNKLDSQANQVQTSIYEKSQNMELPVPHSQLTTLSKTDEPQKEVVTIIREN